MQVTFQIDSAALKETVDDTLASLSLESRQELAARAVSGYLTDLSKDSETLQRLAIPDFKKTGGGRYDREIYVDRYWIKIDNCTEEQILKSDQFRDWFKIEGYKYDLRQQVRQQIASEVTNLAKESVADLVAKDPLVKATIERVTMEFKENLPKFIEAAMTLHFTKTLGQAFSDSAAALVVANSSSNAVQEMQQRLLSNGI